MAIIGEMKKLTIDGSTYTIPEYSLPIASASTLGGVKIGSGLSINSTTGVLSATGGGVTGVKGSSESTYRTGQVSLTAANIGAIPSDSNGNTQDLLRPLQLNGLGDVTLDAKINTLRANRLAFLPANQIIIEKTIDGGTTWVDAGVSDATKVGLFSETRAGVSIPLLNGVKNINCGLRITITGMKYNVPSGTTETSKYNYWNSNYIVSTERYNQLKEMYFWVSANSDTISVKVERATGKASTTWYTIFENNNYGMTGWSGNDYIRFSQGVFGGGTTQTGNYWNYRLTFFTRGPGGSTTLSGTNTSSAQSISEIRGYGDTWWTAGNKFASDDHLYSWDYLQNATFPAKVTASGGFSGNVTGTATGNLTSVQYDSSEAKLTYTKNGSNTDIVTVADLKTALGSMPASDVYSWAKANTKPSYTYTEVGAASSSHAHGNITNGGDITATAPTIADGDQIIINDHSVSKITNGPTFDGSTTTTALTPKGTWESFSKFSGSYTDLTNKPTIPTVPTNVSAFTNDAGYITSADVPEGASAYTGTISEVTSGNASTGSNNGFARGDHVHNITKTTINTVLGTGSGTAKFYREDGTWATPAYTTNTDTKLQVAAVTSGTTYYPIVGTGTTAATRQYDTTGFVYKSTNGTTSAVGSAQLTLGNSTASGTANNKQGQLIIYGSNAKKATITLAAPSADISLALPTSGGTLALTSQIPTVPTSTSSSETGVTATTTATKTTLGTASSIYGVKSGTNSTTTASKASGSNGSASNWVFEDVACDDITAWSAGSGSASFSATVSNHVLSFSHSHTHTAPSLTYSAKTASHVKSGGNGTAPSWSFSDVTVPIRADSATSVPNVNVASATVSISDPGHTHTLS